MEVTYIVIQIVGLAIVAAILGAIMIIGFRRGDENDRRLSERFTLLMQQSAGLTQEMSRKTDTAIDFLREQSILNRQILERVDKH